MVMKHPVKPAPLSERPQVERTHPALVLLQTDGELVAPLRALTGLLAQTLAADFHDAVLVIHLAAPSPLTPGIVTDAGNADRLELPVSGDPREVAETLRERLATLFRRYAYVFVDASAPGPAFTRHLIDELGLVDLDGAVRRLVTLTATDDGWAHLGSELPVSRRAGTSVSVSVSVSMSVSTSVIAPPAWSTLRARLLLPRAQAAPVSPPRQGLRGRVDAARSFASRIGDRLGGSAIEPQGEQYPAARLAPERCRVRLDLDAITAQDEPLLARLPADARGSLSRWARAITWRRVGIALGGSGAWGYAHVALMAELEDRGVPIDLIGGSSSGSLMGAYYCVLGRAGLDLVVARGRSFERLVWMSIITSTVIDLGVDADLGGALLEDLEILLLPVATNLSHARAEVMIRSTVASAVRASASAPGIFASTITRTGLYVDGAVTDNVPVVLVERMGADLLIACNPLPPPLSVRARTAASPLGDFLAELNPVHRLRDLLVSFELMFHDFGDCEDSATRVVYEPASEAGALFRTFDYRRARELVSAVKREDSFREAVDRSERAWKRLARPRAP